MSQLTSTTTDCRSHYHQQLRDIHNGVHLQLVMTEDAIAAASEALLAEDETALETVVKRQADVFYGRHVIESQIVTQLALQAPVASDLRDLIAVLRTLPEIDLAVALAANIAKRGAAHLVSGLTPPLRAITTDLVGESAAMWHTLTDGFDGDGNRLVRTLEAQRDATGGLNLDLMGELLSGAGLRPPVLVEMALVSRFLQRLGDHALEIARCVALGP